MELGKTFLSFRQIYLGPNLVGFKKQILNQAKFLHLMPFDQALSNTTKVIIWCIQNTRIYVVRQYRVCLSDGFWKLALEDIILQWIWFFLSRLGLPKQHCKNNLDDESWNSNEIVDYEDGKWLVYLMVSIHLLQVIQIFWSVKRKPVETSPLFRITRHHLLLSLQVLSYFSDCYVPSRNLVGTNWKKIYFWI